MISPDDAPATPSRTLRQTTRGDRVRLCSVDASDPMLRRLADLGLTTGAALTVVQTSSTAIVVAARGTRIALGRHLADHVVVEPA